MNIEGKIFSYANIQLRNIHISRLCLAQFDFTLKRLATLYSKDPVAKCHTLNTDFYSFDKGI